MRKFMLDEAFWKVNIAPQQWDQKIWAMWAMGLRSNKQGGVRAFHLTKAKPP